MMFRLFDRWRLKERKTFAAVGAESFNRRATQEDLRYCYRLLLGRNPDPVGWQSFSSALAGKTVDNLVLNFLTSQEFKAGNLYMWAFGSGGSEPPLVAQAGGLKLFVSSRDRSVGKFILDHGTYEPHVTKQVKRVLAPGMVFLDIGANIGYFSMIAAQQVGPEGRVLSFEPSQENCVLLALSAAANGFPQVEIYPVAVAERGQTFLYDRLLGSNGAISDVDFKTLSESGLSVMTGKTVIRAVALDEMLSGLKRLDVIKIDVEGAEYRAMQGAKRLIEAFRPVIFSEFAPGGLQNISHVDGPEYLRLLVGWGYGISILSRTRWLIDCGKDIGKVMDHYAGKGLHHIDLMARPQ